MFLYECLMGFRMDRKQPNDLCNLPSLSENLESRPICGCILADEMGLGKTVQAIAVLWLLLKQGPYGGHPVVRRCLIITPSTLIQNWIDEISKWLGRERLPAYGVNQNSPIKGYPAGSNMAPPVLIMSYEMFLQHAKTVYEIQGLDLVICDEAHRLKNSEINTSLALRQLPARRRLLLTGTPIQNNLEELWSLANFCAPGKLGHSPESFRREFIKGTSNRSRAHLLDGGEADDDPWEDVNEKQNIFSTILSTFLLRRTTDVLKRELTSRSEHIVFCQASSLQTRLSSTLHNWIERTLDLSIDPVSTASLSCQADSSGDFYAEDSRDSVEVDIQLTEEDESHDMQTILCAITALRKLHNHPNLLRNFIDSSANAEKRRRLPARITDELLRIFRETSTASTTGSPSINVQDSGKLAVLHHMLQQLFTIPLRNRMCEAPAKRACRPRLVLVSNFTQTLDILEGVCTRVTNQRPLRLDGKTPTKRRSEIVKEFNDVKCAQSILLLSSRAGGTGLNLVGANHLIMYDMDWNPANDAQAMARIWRPGQARPVHLYRLITAGSLEERMFQRQAAKLALSHNAFGSSLDTLGKSCSSTRSGVLTREELRDLFKTAPDTTSSWTHEMIGCTCKLNSQSLSPTLSGDSTSPKPDAVDVRSCQLGLGTCDPSESTTPRAGSVSESLAFLLKWTHSLMAWEIDRLGDPLLTCPVNDESFPPTSLISAVFSLISDHSEKAVNV